LFKEHFSWNEKTMEKHQLELEEKLKSIITFK